MDITVEHFSSASTEENVYRTLYRVANVRRRMQLGGPVSSVGIAVGLFGLTHILTKLSKSVREHPFQLPTQREHLIECLSTISGIRVKVTGVIEASEQKGLPERMIFGKAIHQRLKAAANALLRVEEVWQVELNNCFPELFSDLGRIISSIEPGVLPNMSHETLALAKQALEATERRHNVDIDEWAKSLSKDVVDQND